MYKKIVLGVVFFMVAISGVFAQDALTRQQEGKDDNVMFRNQLSGGLIVHSGGFGIDLMRGKHVTGYKTRILQFEAVNMRDLKEHKTQNPYFQNSKGFYYGKLNSLLILRTGVGYQNLKYRKTVKTNVAISYVYFAGASLGLAKPVYLDILHDTPQQYEFTLTTEKYDPSKHFIDNIYGRAPYFKGFGEMKVYPGGYATFGVNFDYADSYSSIKAIETGITVDAYPKVIPIMAFSKNKQVFVSLYINFIYGRKWF